MQKVIQVNNQDEQLRISIAREYLYDRHCEEIEIEREINVSEMLLMYPRFLIKSLARRYTPS